MATVKKSPVLTRSAHTQTPAVGAMWLEKAMQHLVLTEDQRRYLSDVLRENQRMWEEMKRRPAAHRSKPHRPADEKKKKKPKKVDQKDLNSELKKIEAIKAAKLEAERNKIHRKSGFTSYIRRAPGSFEGSSK